MLTQPDVQGEQVKLSVSDEVLLKSVDKIVGSNSHQGDVRVVGSDKHRKIQKSGSFSVLLTQKVNPVLLPDRSGQKRKEEGRKEVKECLDGFPFVLQVILEE